MSIQITHVRYGSTPKTEQAISHFKWEGNGPGYGTSSDKQTLVAWLEQGSNTAYVGSGSNRVNVIVVQGTPKYLRTHADGQWTNNLTSLPEF